MSIGRQLNRSTAHFLPSKRFTCSKGHYLFNFYSYVLLSFNKAIVTIVTIIIIIIKILVLVRKEVFKTANDWKWESRRLWCSCSRSHWWLVKSVSLECLGRWSSLVYCALGPTFFWQGEGRGGGWVEDHLHAFCLGQHFAAIFSPGVPTHFITISLIAIIRLSKSTMQNKFTKFCTSTPYDRNVPSLISLFWNDMPLPCLNQYRAFILKVQANNVFDCYILNWSQQTQFSTSVPLSLSSETVDYLTLHPLKCEYNAPPPISRQILMPIRWMSTWCFWGKKGVL